MATSNENFDVEKSLPTPRGDGASISSAEEHKESSYLRRLASYGVELRGIAPVALKDRTDTRAINVFSFWWTVSLGLLPIITGLVGTYYEGLSLRDASLVILFFCLLGAIPPATFGVLGPQTGLRQMIQTRYSFGLYGVTLIVLLNMATITGWTIVSTTVAGQTLSAVSGGSMTVIVGIVITALAGLLLSFLGYRAIHLYERYAWIPALIGVIIMTGCGGKLLKNQTPTEPAQPQIILTYGCIVTGFLISWAAMASDFAVYIDPNVPKLRIFSYIYAGLLIPTVPLMVLGAAIGGAIGSVPEWTDAFALYSTGGVVNEMLTPAGGFGKFVAVVLAFSILGNMAGSMYSISIQFQTLMPLLAPIPRVFFSVVTAAVIIGASIPISKEFVSSLESFLGVIAYWAAIYVGIFAAEHIYFRKGNAASYDHAIWNVGSKLPLGAAALASTFLPFALIVPCMMQTWYTGPIAKHTGDIGFEVGFVLAVLFYIPLRTIEIKIICK
ncbi:purine-cytosine permease FCY22 [Bisporella sp. PMI_857]|nr:purine-cytosine permease FCY22 [Bisporella sp. PMI_857]